MILCPIKNDLYDAFLYLNNCIYRCGKKLVCLILLIQTEIYLKEFNKHGKISKSSKVKNMA